MAKRLITVNDILAGHVSLDVACLDRIYLNGYLPTVQVPEQVVQFLQHLGVGGDVGSEQPGDEWPQGRVGKTYCLFFGWSYRSMTRLKLFSDQ